MGYQFKPIPVIIPSILIFSEQKSNFDLQETETRRFGIFCSALSDGGCEAIHSFFSTKEEFLKTLDLVNPSVVFCAIHETKSTKGDRYSVHGILESRGMPYIGSLSRTIDLVISKSALKSLWSTEGIPTPSWFTLGCSPGEAGYNRDKIKAARDFPYIVKPDREGNSRGISADCVVNDAESLQMVARKLMDEFGGNVIAEHFLNDADRREFTVAMIGNGDSRLILPAELCFAEKRAIPVISNEDKTKDTTDTKPLDDESLEKRIKDIASSAFRAAGLRDYARGDFILSGGMLSAIEINGQPMVPDRWFLACAQFGGLDEKTYLNAIILEGMRRLHAEGMITFAPPDSMIEIVEQRTAEGASRE